VEARDLHTNIIIVTTKLLYDHILTWFNYPLTIVTNQGTHFINDVIHYLIDHFILKHILVLLSITHKEMDKVSLLTKSSKHYSQNWWMRTGMIGMNTCPQFHYFIKLPLRLEPVTSIPFQLVYGLHSLLLT
jgi:hypothetical protein